MNTLNQGFTPPNGVGVSEFFAEEENDDGEENQGIEAGAIGIEKGSIQYILQQYLNEIGKREPLTRAQEKELVDRAHNGDRQALRDMIKANLPLVIKTVTPHVNRGVELLELIQESNIGLIKAVEKFEPEKGFKFSTYAVWWIRDAIGYAVRKHSRTVYVPQQMITKAKHNQKKRAELKKVGIKVSACDVDDDLLLRGMVQSLNDLIPFEDDSNSHMTFESMLTDENLKDPDELVHKDALSKITNELLNNLKPRDRQIICEIFGLDGCEIYMEAEIASRYKVSRSIIKHIKQNSLKNMRKLMQYDGYELDDFFFN